MRYLFMIVALFVCTSCVSTGKKIEPEKLTQFEKGRTTYHEVVQQLGQPTQSTMNSDGSRTIMYTYAQSQMRATNFIPIVGALVGGTDSEMTAVMLNFDKNGVLTDYSATEGSSTTGTGLTSGARQ
jgi:outer membrane protein assembly factor BamE (lipoprotein component of BamABCDE complex)